MLKTKLITSEIVENLLNFFHFFLIYMILGVDDQIYSDNMYIRALKNTLIKVSF